MPVSPKDTDLKWLAIEDFTPGVVTNANFASILAANYKGPVPGNRPGIAQAGLGGPLQTFGCIGLPSGGLAPLPGVVIPAWNSGLQPVAPHHAATAGGGATNLITGLFISSPLQYFGASPPFPLTTGEELIVGQAQVAAGPGNMSAWVDSLQINGASAAWNNIFTLPPNPQLQPYCTMTGGITRANNSPSLIGNPTWALQYTFTGAAAGSIPNPGPAYVWCYPDPTAPGTTFAPFNLVTSSTAAAYSNVLCHQNRIIMLATGGALWTSADTRLAGNEEFYYTDPPNGLAVAGPFVFVQEDPSGYGAWGSQSASELFLVKNNGGGAVISGDLNSPTVTRLPGVTPAYNVMSRGASTPVGFVYASGNNGLWAWNGGNVSQKISTQLEDNFFAKGLGVVPPIEYGPTVDICRWRDYIVVSGDWLYDTITGSWWKMAPGNGATGHMWFAASADGTTLYAAQAVPTTAYFMDVYSATAPTSNYQWASYPLRLSSDSKNRNYIIKEVVIRAQGHGSVQVNVYDQSGLVGGTSPSGPFTFVSPSQPVMERIVIGGNSPGPLVSEDIQIELTSTAFSGTTAAPVIYSVAIGYQEADGLVNAT